MAHLVGKGLSNPEIAAELFISRKAVEYHLGNIYASDLYLALRASSFIAQTDEELAACQLPAGPARTQHPMPALTSRETEVAHLVGKGLSNPEIAAELFISRKAVEYHLGNIYAKCGVTGRQQLRRFVGQWRQPTAALSRRVNPHDPPRRAGRPSGCRF